MTSRRCLLRRVAIGVTVASLGILASPISAQADPIGDARVRAAQLAAQIDALGVKESALSEQYDKAVLAEQAAAGQVSAARQQVQAASAATGTARQQVRKVAVDAYTGGGVAGLANHVDLRSAQDEVLRSEYASMLAANQQDALDRYRTAEKVAATAEGQLSAAQQQAARNVAAVRSAETSVQQAQTSLEATYRQVQGQLATLVAQAQAAQEAQRQRQAQEALAQQRAAQQAQAAQSLPLRTAAAQPSGLSPAVTSPHEATGPVSPVTGAAPSAPPAAAGPVSSPPLQAAPTVPNGSGGGAAVAAAMTRLGDPYVWGAAGPNSFDCSGLTMWAWAHAGVSLPHYSGAQYAATTHIPMSDLQPGDLVFFADPGEHEGMYIGNGQIIEAPHTGAVVRIQPLYSQYVLASRP